MAFQTHHQAGEAHQELWEGRLLHPPRRLRLWTGMDGASGSEAVDHFDVLPRCLRDLVQTVPWRTRAPRACGMLWRLCSSLSLLPPKTVLGHRESLQVPVGCSRWWLGAGHERKLLNVVSEDWRPDGECSSAALPDLAVSGDVLALTRSRINLKEAPAGRRLEEVKQAMMRVHSAI